MQRNFYKEVGIAPDKIWYALQISEELWSRKFTLSPNNRSHNLLLDCKCFDVSITQLSTRFLSSFILSRQTAFLIELTLTISMIIRWAQQLSRFSSFICYKNWKILKLSRSLFNVNFEVIWTSYCAMQKTSAINEYITVKNNKLVKRLLFISDWRPIYLHFNGTVNGLYHNIVIAIVWSIFVIPIDIGVKKMWSPKRQPCKSLSAFGCVSVDLLNSFSHWNLRLALMYSSSCLSRILLRIYYGIGEDWRKYCHMLSSFRTNYLMKIICGFFFLLQFSAKNFSLSHMLQ